MSDSISIGFITFRSADGRQEEGCAIRQDDDRKPLPDDTWNVSFKDGTKRIIAVDDMPAHWIEQLRRWGVFSRGFLGQTNPGP